MKTIWLDGSRLSISEVAAVARGGCRARLSSAARRRMDASRRIVVRAAREGRILYGVTTGFGRFSDVPIPNDRVRALQRNLLLSHAAGVGDPLDVETVRAMIVLRANALAKGYSGIRGATVAKLLQLIDRGIFPVVPSQGSVGASGDLAPLAHLALPLLGEGEVFYRGRRVRARSALRREGLAPVRLEAKEGLALINGIQMTAAIGALALTRAEKLLRAADLAGALSLEGARGTDAAFAERLIALRPHPGAITVARNLRRLIRGSAIRESHRECRKVQDNYALRCMPQVHGAARDGLTHLRRALEIEINSATDNPLVFEDGQVVSGGNFHGAPLAGVLDLGALLMTTLASISERRIEKLTNPALSGLPAFLVSDGGLNSGLMMAQYTAAALVSECKTLSHPASVDSIPTGAGKEDHVSMSPIAARKFASVVECVEKVLAIELVVAVQALEFLRPLRSSPLLERARAAVRRRIRPWDRDRYLAPDLDAARRVLASGLDSILDRLD
jgi:histidine ammonia-lyase